MLIIVPSLNGHCARPKYHPRKRREMWYVRDTELGENVFGPAIRDLCERFQNGENPAFPITHVFQ